MNVVLNCYPVVICWARAQELVPDEIDDEVQLSIVESTLMLIPRIVLFYACEVCCISRIKQQSRKQPQTALRMTVNRKYLLFAQNKSAHVP
jgi:hypothetical protein